MAAICLWPRTSRRAPEKLSRNSLIAGSVRTKSPMAPPRMTRIRFRSVTGDGAGENRGAVKKNEAVGKAPPAVGPRAPIDLVAQQIGHRHPDEAGDDQDIGKDSHEQAAGFVSEKGGIEQRFGREKEKNPERARGQKLVHEPQHEKKSDWEHEEKRLSERRKLSHFHGREQPEAPEERERQEHETAHAG